MARGTFTYEGKRYDVTAKDDKELAAKIALKKKALEDGQVILNKNTPVSKWSFEWLDTYKAGSVGNATYKRYKGIINNQIIPEIGSFKVKDVKQAHLQKILNKETGKSKDHIERVRYTLQQIFNKALANKMIVSNPTIGLDMPKAEDGTHRSITEEERKYILQLAESHRGGMFVKLMLYCGLRPQEIAVLTWSNVDLNEQEIYISNAREAKTNEIKDPKSKAGIRVIPIPDILVNDLKKIKGLPKALVLPNPNTGRMYTGQAMYRMWHNFKRELDILMGAKLFRNEIVKSVVAEDLVPYCLRHTYCTDLQDAGIALNVAKDFMGHADVRVTANIYTHRSAKAFKDAANAINKFHCGNDCGSNASSN